MEPFVAGSDELGCQAQNIFFFFLNSGQFPALITALSFTAERNQWEDVGEAS